jgi:protein SCO1/2
MARIIRELAAYRQNASARYRMLAQYPTPLDFPGPAAILCYYPRAVTPTMNRQSFGFRRQIVLAMQVAAIVGLLPPALHAQSKHHVLPSADPGHPSVLVSGLLIPDVTLLNQHGDTVHFYSDLIKGKVVAINTIFTTCTTICPLMGANFVKLRKILGDRANQQVNLISISVDPLVDTPERLDEWSRKFGQTGAGWTLLTGPKADIDNLLRALHVSTADKLDHAPVALIGGDGVGDWARASALLPPSRLANLIQARLELGSNR